MPHPARGRHARPGRPPAALDALLALWAARLAPLNRPLPPAAETTLRWIGVFAVLYLLARLTAAVAGLS